MVSLYEIGEDGKLKFVDSVDTDKNGVYTFSSARPNKEYIIKVYEPLKEDGIQNVAVVKASTEPTGLERGLDIATIEYSKPIPTNEKTEIDKQANGILGTTNVKSSLSNNTSTNDKSVMRDSGQPPASAIFKNGMNYKQQDPSDSFYAIVYFGFDLDNLTAKSIKTVDSVISYMKANPLDQFILLGHADEVGDIEYNIDLSKRRVFTVTKYMGSKGIDTKRLRLSYFGEQRPAQTNTTSKEYLRLNRRVEFILIKNDPNN